MTTAFDYEHTGHVADIEKIEVIRVSTLEGKGTNDSIARLVSWYYNPDTFELMWYDDPSVQPRMAAGPAIRLWQRVLTRLVNELNLGRNAYDAIYDIAWPGPSNIEEL